MSDRRSSWLYAFVIISLFLCCITLLMPLLPKPFGYFNLRDENNFAALFSGVFLLVIALHAYDGWSLNRVSNPSMAYAWLALSLVLTALSIDEIGSLHERVTWLRSIIADGTIAPPADIQSLPRAERRSIYWWSLLPFGVLFVGVIVYAVLALWRDIGDKKPVVFIGVGFLLLASVSLQEYIERTVDWSANPYLKIIDNTLRPALEEGTELLGMIILLAITMKNTRGIFRQGEHLDFPVFEATVRLRRAILVTGVFAAPLIAYVTASFPPERHDNGMPADWPAAALFFLAAIAAVRPFFVSGQGLGWTGRILLLLSLVGCASTILQPDNPSALPLAGALAGTALLIWLLSPDYDHRTYLPAGVFLSIGFATAWYIGSNVFIVYTVIQYTALAFYWVHSSADPTRIQSTSVDREILKNDDSRSRSSSSPSLR
jgi:hypothetical protein